MRMGGQDAALGQAVKGLPVRCDEKEKELLNGRELSKGTIRGLADSGAAY